MTETAKLRREGSSVDEVCMYMCVYVCMWRRRVCFRKGRRAISLAADFSEVEDAREELDEGYDGRQGKS